MQQTADKKGYISTSDEKRETLGTQLLRQWEKEESYKQEAKETTNEITEQYCRELESIISNARRKGFKKTLYIHVCEQELGLIVPNAIKWVFFGRATRPDPEWNTTLYTHKYGDEFPKLEWSLPKPEHIGGIMAHRGKYTKKFLEDIDLMIRRKLV